MQRRSFLKTAAGALALPFAQSALAQHQHSPISLHQPTRYAFVADLTGYYITIVDIFTGETIDAINFGFNPKVFEMARDDAMLAVGSPQIPEIHLFNLHTRQKTRIELPSPVYQMFFVPQSKWLAIALQDQVGMLNYQTMEIKIFAKRFDSEARSTFLNTYYSLLFSSFSQSFWVLDEDKPLIYHNYGTNPAGSEWEVHDLTGKLKTNTGLGVGVASPEDYMLALTTDDGSEGLLYFPETKALLSTGDMYTAGTTNEPMIMPYINAYSNRVIFADVSGNVALFDFTRGKPELERFRVDFAPKIARTGWLETTWILGGDRGLLFQSFDNPKEQKRFEFPYEIKNMWVTGDSKLLLATIDEEVSQLFRYDIRRKEMLPPIRLRNVVMGEKIRMGSNNSICY